MDEACDLQPVLSQLTWYQAERSFPIKNSIPKPNPPQHGRFPQPPPSRSP